MRFDSIAALVPCVELSVLCTKQTVKKQLPDARELNLEGYIREIIKSDLEEEIHGV